MKKVIAALAFAAAAFVYANASSHSQVAAGAQKPLPSAEVRAFMGTPMYAKELDASGIGSILKKKVSKQWLQRQFASNDPTVIDEIYEYILSINDPCPCPYLRYSNDDRRCGKNTSYLRGTLGKLCYPKDVIEARASSSKSRSNSGI